MPDASVPAFEDWPDDARQRELNAQHTFGDHLIRNVVAEARAGIPPDAPTETRLVCESAIERTVALFLALLEGVPDTCAGAATRVEYQLTAVFRDRDGAVAERHELAPGGDGLLMGFAGWTKGDFGAAQRARATLRTVTLRFAEHVNATAIHGSVADIATHYHATVLGVAGRAVRLTLAAPRLPRLLSFLEDLEREGVLKHEMR